MIGPLLKHRRKALGLSAAQVAAQASVTREYLSAIEAGKRQAGVKTLVALTDLFTISTQEWLDAYLSDETRMAPTLQLAEHFVQVGDLQSAETVARKLRAIARHSHRYQGRFYHLLGVLSYRQGRYGRALHWFTTYERTSGATPSIAHSEGIYNVALALRKAGRVVASVEKFDVATRMFGTLNARTKVGYARLSKANTLMAMGAYPEGLLAYRRAAANLRGDPWFFDCRLGEAICECRTQSPRKGITLLQKVERYAVDPDRKIKLHHNLGVMCRLAGHVGEAIEHLKAGLEQITPPPRPDSFAELCLCYALGGDETGAREALQQFQEFTGAKDDQDVVAMSVMALALGVDATPRQHRRPIRENYECRISTALEELLSQQVGAIAKRHS